MSPAEDTTMLQVQDVEGGAIGLWNNRGRTEKVRKGDFVVKVRKAGASDWVAGDAKQMLMSLYAEGPFEVEIKRAPAQEVLTVESAPVAAAPVEAPTAAAEAAEAPQETPEVAADEAVEAPQKTPEVAADVVIEAEGAAKKGGCLICL